MSFIPRNHKVVLREIFHSHHDFTQTFCGFPAHSLLHGHTPGEGPVHSRERGRPESQGRRQLFHICLLLRGLSPAQDWRCFLPLVRLFISSLLFTVKWATATLWSVLRASLLFQAGRRVWPRLTELNVGQIWKNHQRLCRTGVSTSAPLTFWARQPFVVGPALCILGPWAASLGSH